MEITTEMLDAIQAVKGKRVAALWDPRCEQYFLSTKEKPSKETDTPSASAAQ